MEPLIRDYLSELSLGEIQIFQNMAIMPLFVPLNGGPDYRLLKEALDQAEITITEIGQSGSVPELQVINTVPRPILLLDGEELVGAKQNRVLNTTILLKGNSETIIPVSCTEQGRWRYTSPTFSDSGVIMSQQSRAIKTDTVTSLLHSGLRFASDQSRVWANVRKLHADAGTTSQTMAMRDVYTAKTEELEAYGEAFGCVTHQRGSLVFINGAPVGLDVVSREEAYAGLHPKLVRSYAIDALLDRKNGHKAPSRLKAKALLTEAQNCEVNRYDSIGLGYDYRLEGEKVVGSALVFEKTIIHMALFRLKKHETKDFMSSYLQRRGFRRNRD
jgi:hypothetical protein